jgi:CMP/dCMP kinase
VRENIHKRDRIDSTREDSPLMQAKDAIVLDNSEMTVDEQMTWFREVYRTIMEKENDAD